MRMCCVLIDATVRSFHARRPSARVRVENRNTVVADVRDRSGVDADAYIVQYAGDRAPSVKLSITQTSPYEPFKRDEQALTLV